MSHADQLIEIATELAMDAKDNVAGLQHKLSAIETAKVEIEGRLHIANHALQRLSSFVSVRGSDLQCPRCWINNEVTASATRNGRQRQRISMRDLQKQFQSANLRTTSLQRTHAQRI
jgi:NMD protein affecting ribosome stability and mRNA decay